MENEAAATTLAVAGAVCWSIQLIPQIIVNYRRHHARGLHASMMFLWAIAGVPLGVYNISHNLHPALQVQAQILTALSLVTWAQCMYYNAKWSILKVASMACGIGSILAGIEVGLVYALRLAIAQHLEWPSILVAAISAALLASGVLRHYWDIYQTRTVRGISFLFVGIDALGDLTSLLSLLFRVPFDTLGAVIYGTELVLWIGIMLCGLVLGTDDSLPADLAMNGVTDVGSVPALTTASARVDSADVIGRSTSRVASSIGGSSIRSRHSNYSVFRTASLRSVLDE
ncbi:PQ loop repeat-domain-containing protein [Dioszegia hungarica]|uniref:PQ loop repeat-domain-containing protein n=1 Tax=Dioszegia hungarica TaxID=4972 RepID=A0AA38HBY0_9TREE|nr:PQ loop repeat-domain-containing protein [Dioszegia hungarica]KAI9638633.1 PQ loop repeat-domain-containing protein [Dioszegia hungarica]